MIVLDNLILVDELFARVLRRLETFALVSNNFCGNLVSSLELPIKFDERFKPRKHLLIFKTSLKGL